MTDAETVIKRLEDAGRTLLALPGTGSRPAGYGSSWPPVVHSMWEAYASSDLGSELEEMVRPDPPAAAAITAMDEAWQWVPLIDKVEIRRIVLMRSLVHPVTDRHIWPFRKIGHCFGMHMELIRDRHATGIDTIVSRLNRKHRAHITPDFPDECGFPCTGGPNLV